MGNPFTLLLNDLANPADKEILGKLSPDGQNYISGGFMRQSEFNSKFDKIRSTLGGRTPEEMANLAKTWEPWVAGQRPEWERRYNEYPTVAAKATDLEAKYAAAQAEINTLKAAAPNAEGSIDVAKLSQAVRDSLLGELKPMLGNFLTKDDAAKLKEEAAQTAWSRTADNLIPASMSAMELSQRYFREFGEPMSHETILKVAAESGRKGQESLDFAWNQLAGPKLEAKRQADFDKKLKDAEERGRMRGMSDAQTHGNLPPGMEEAAGGFTFTKPVESIDELPADYELGQKGGFRLAGIAAEELRKMGAARAQGQ